MLPTTKKTFYQKALKYVYSPKPQTMIWQQHNWLHWWAGASSLCCRNHSNTAISDCGLTSRLLFLWLQVFQVCLKCMLSLWCKMTSFDVLLLLCDKVTRRNDATTSLCLLTICCAGVFIFMETLPSGEDLLAVLRTLWALLLSLLQIFSHDSLSSGRNSAGSALVASSCNTLKSCTTKSWLDKQYTQWFLSLSGFSGEEKALADFKSLWNNLTECKSLKGGLIFSLLLTYLCFHTLLESFCWIHC